MSPCCQDSLQAWCHPGSQAAEEAWRSSYRLCSGPETRSCPCCNPGSSRPMRLWQDYMVRDAYVNDIAMDAC